MNENKNKSKRRKENTSQTTTGETTTAQSPGKANQGENKAVCGSRAVTPAFHYLAGLATAVPHTSVVPECISALVTFYASGKQLDKSLKVDLRKKN